MFTRLRPLITTLTIVLMACSPSVGDRSAAIENGDPPTHGLAGAVLVLHKSKPPVPGGRTAFCSGIQLAGGTKVLTAAHCLDHFLIDKSASELPGSSGALALRVAGVVAIGGDSIVAGSFSSGTGAEATTEAFLTHYPAGSAEEPSSIVSNTPGGAGITAVVTSPSGVVAAGWIGRGSARRPALLRPNSSNDGILTEALPELGTGAATALFSYQDGGMDRLLVAGYTVEHGVRYAFVREYDSSWALRSVPLGRDDSVASHLRVSDLSVRNGGTIVIVGTESRAAKRALVVEIPSGEAPRVTEVVAGWNAWAVATAGDGAAVVLVGQGDSSRLYRVHNGQSTLLRDLSLAGHYRFNGYTQDLSGAAYVGFRARDLALDNAGRIIVVGTVRSDVESSPAVLRLTSAGIPDVNFGARGIVITDLTGRNTKSVLPGGATAVAVVDDTIHVAGRGIRRARRIAGVAPGHVLVAARYSATREGSSRGMPLADTTAISSVIMHDTEDLAIATLSSPRPTTANSVLQWPSDAADAGVAADAGAAAGAAADAGADAGAVGTTVSCVGMGASDASFGTITQGEFKIHRQLTTTAFLRGASTNNYEFIGGDSGGGCFSSSGAFVGVMTNRLTSRSKNKITGVVVRDHIVRSFVNLNR